MKALKHTREQRGLSQRRLGKLARISYKSIQLLESGKHDPRVSTLQSVARALGYPPDTVQHRLESLFTLPSDSVAVISERIAMVSEDAWKTWLFNFVDAFRRTKDPRYVEVPPVSEVSDRMRALLASTVETLCEELGIPTPWWCLGVTCLPIPWFVSGVENLKVSALIESPIHFRKRNIFVLGNFLDRR